MDNRYPSVEDLRKLAKKRIPKFAFEYLDGGCNEDVNIKKNTERIRKIELKPEYLIDYKFPLIFKFCIHNFFNF